MDPRSLREATRAEHEATEALMPLMTPDLKLETYVRVLQVLFPLLRSWEAWLENVADGELGAMLQSRRRSHFLEEDLRVFRAEPADGGMFFVDWDAVVKGPAGSGVENGSPESFQAKLLGAVYVMEGSTLGGRFLARHVEAALDLTPGVGNSYFQGHGEATGAMWREVLEWIRAVPEEQGSLTISAAKRTFGVFGEALRTGLPAVHAVGS